jgi:hypothetical protein
MDTPRLLHESEMYFSSIYLYILTEEQKGERRRICDIALNAAANYNMNPVRNVMFARAAVFLSPLKNSSSCGKS